jgi:glycine/D-amino acid oxidase-like deaminating enzyme
MATTDVAVIGGGCVGLASAIALADRGASVTVLERGLPGAANSTHQGGGIRQQFGTELNIRLSLLSAGMWDQFAERYGVDPLFRPSGYLFLTRTDKGAETLAAHVRLQNSLGVNSEFLDAYQIVERWPELAARAFAGAGFRAADGWANQHRIVDGFVRGAISAGVELRAGTEALALERSRGRVIGVVSTAGLVAADAVLMATGPWVKPLLDPLGLTVPVVGRRHELLIVEPAEPLPPDLPWLIGVEDGVHVRNDAEGRAQVGGFLGEDRAVDPDRYDLHADDDWVQAVLGAAEHAFGIVGPGAQVRHGWAGLYPTTPDRHPIIDCLADGLFAALGFSGTGVMHAPAAGLLSAELIIDGGMRSADAALLSAGRFTDVDVEVETTGF